MLHVSVIRLACLAAFLLAVSLVVGCGPSGPINEKVTEENWSKVKTGMKLSEIETILGPSTPGSRPASADKPEDADLTWKKWQRSSRDPEFIVGFDAKNEAELVDWPKKMK